MSFSFIIFIISIADLTFAVVEQALRAHLIVY